jgi:hypothetical protein
MMANVNDNNDDPERLRLAQQQEPRNGVCSLSFLPFQGVLPEHEHFRFSAATIVFAGLAFLFLSDTYS